MKNSALASILGGLGVILVLAVGGWAMNYWLAQNDGLRFVCPVCGLSEPELRNCAGDPTRAFTIGDQESHVYERPMSDGEEDETCVASFTLIGEQVVGYELKEGLSVFTSPFEPTECAQILFRCATAAERKRHAERVRAE